MPGIGKIILNQTTGRPTRVSADGYPEWMPIGGSIAWDLVTPVGGPTTLPDGTVLQTGEQGIQYGTVMVQVVTADQQTITVSATGGTFTVSLTRNGSTQTTAPLAFNVSAANMQTALQALTNVGSGRVAVTLAGAVYTITFIPMMGAVAALVTDASLLTGGGTSATVAVVTAGSSDGGMWAPFDSTQTDGRQTLAKGSVGIMDVTLKFAELTVMGANLNNALTGLIVGGLVWRQRLGVGGTNQPSLVDLLTALPRLTITPLE